VGLEVLAVKTVETLLPGEMVAAQKALLAGDLTLFQLLLTEGVSHRGHTKKTTSDETIACSQFHKVISMVT
jgi:hypothetical protein